MLLDKGFVTVVAGPHGLGAAVRFGRFLACSRGEVRSGGLLAESPAGSVPQLQTSTSSLQRQWGFVTPLV